MFHPDATSGAKRAVTVAWQLAGPQADAEITRALLLQGLLAEEEGRAVALLQEASGKHDIRQRLLNSLSTTSKVVEQLLEQQTEETVAGMLKSPSAVRWLYAVRGLALEATGTATISSEHLLLHLVETDGEVQQLLQSVDITYDVLRLAVLGEVDVPLPMEEEFTVPVSTERQSAQRILDANANRAREAFRILEEYARFHLEDTFLSESLKKLRHRFSQAMQLALPAETLVHSRDTIGDVGTTITTPSESQRQSLQAIVLANFKRLQEALRTIEEYSKIEHSKLAKETEAIRYQSYTLEKALLIGGVARSKLASASLYLLISRAGSPASLEWTISEAVAGGVDVVQLREKQVEDKELLQLAKRVREVTRKVGAIFILNDRADLATLCDADGVHLGQNDVAVKQARAILGSEKLVGVSTHSLEQLRQAILDGADYVGVGPTFQSKTKEFSHFAGLAFVKQAAAETKLPAFAIGGINEENTGQVVEAGLRRIAVSSVICQAEEPRQVAATLKRTLRQ